MKTEERSESNGFVPGSIEKGDGNAESRRVFVEPKLNFVEPKLEKQGSISHLTGFFGTFSP